MSLLQELYHLWAHDIWSGMPTICSCEWSLPVLAFLQILVSRGLPQVIIFLVSWFCHNEASIKNLTNPLLGEATRCTVLLIMKWWLRCCVLDYWLNSHGFQSLCSWICLTDFKRIHTWEVKFKAPTEQIGNICHNKCIWVSLYTCWNFWNRVSDWQRKFQMQFTRFPVLCTCTCMYMCDFLSRYVSIKV